jgi:hypothetical protein
MSLITLMRIRKVVRVGRIRREKIFRLVCLLTIRTGVENVLA